MRSTVKSAFGMASVIALSFCLQPYRLVVVRGRSMSPTLEDGEILLARPMGRAPRVGDIVLADVDGSILIKRVTRVPGDCYQELFVRHINRWIVMDNLAQKRMVKKGHAPSRVSQVPDGQVFLEGDNPDHSVDSRSFGYVPISSIRGLVAGE